MIAFSSSILAAFHGWEGVSNLGLENFIANDESDYYKKALEFYENHNKIEKIGIDLRDQALSSPLLDAKNFSKNFYNKLHEIYTSH